MPFQDPITDPKETIHVAYHEALQRFANGWIESGQDGDPPNAFVPQSAVVKVADLLAGVYDLDTLITQPFTAEEFIFRGPAAAVFSDYPNTILGGKQVIAALASAAVAPTGSDLTINFQYEGVDVLSTPLAIPVGSAVKSRHYSLAIAIPQLLRPNALDPAGDLYARIVSVDSGGTAANIRATLITQQIAA